MDFSRWNICSATSSIGPNLVFDARLEIHMIAAHSALEFHCHILGLHLRGEFDEPFLQQAIFAFLCVFAGVLHARVVQIVQLEIVGRGWIHPRCQPPFNFQYLVHQMLDASRPSIVVENRYDGVLALPAVGPPQAAAQALGR